MSENYSVCLNIFFKKDFLLNLERKT